MYTTYTLYAHTPAAGPVHLSLAHTFVIRSHVLYTAIWVYCLDQYQDLRPQSDAVCC